MCLMMLYVIEYKKDKFSVKNVKNNFFVLKLFTFLHYVTC